MDKQQHPTLGDQLRFAMKLSGRTLYEIAKGSGVALPVLWRFATEQRDLRLNTASKVARYLGWELRPVAVKGRNA